MQVRARVHLEDQVDDLAQRHVGGMRPRPAAPAHVVADAILRDSFERVVEHVDVAGEPRVVLVEGPRRHHSVVRHRGPGVVHLQQETGIDDRRGTRSAAPRRARRRALRRSCSTRSSGRESRWTARRPAGRPRPRRPSASPLSGCRCRAAARRGRCTQSGRRRRVVPRDVRPVLAVAAAFEFGIELMKALAVGRLAQKDWRP